MKIVGVGCGPGMLTETAIAAIRAAKKCYGSDRAIRLAKPYLSSACAAFTVTDFHALQALQDEDAVVLSTGDPMLGGLGNLTGEVIPGISSLQLACARLKIPWLRVVALTAHAKDRQESFHAIQEEIVRGKIAFVLADPQFDIDACAAYLVENGISCDLAICENLGYLEERIVAGTVASPPRVTSPLFCLIVGAFH
jgi:cobalt-precorrin-7 (C5)-methyltransferase